jgi:putative ABC transport system permease protein
MKKGKSITPPRLAEKIFDWCCSNAAVDDLRGDMEELFYLNLGRMSVTRAKFQYWKQVFALIFSYALKKRKQNSKYHTLSTNTFNMSMLKNYFLIASRNLVKHKFFTIINVLGLAVGMSMALLLIALLSFVSTYDDFHENKNNIYRIISKTDDHINNRQFASAPAVLADRLKNEYHGVKEVVRIDKALNVDAEYDGKQLPLNGYFVDSNFLTVFSFPVLKGNPATAFEKTNTLLITEKASQKIFGDADPIGKVITMGSFGDFEISGLLKNHPKNSHMQFEVLASYQNLEKAQHQSAVSIENQWKEFRDSYVYLLLPDRANPNDVEKYANSIAQEIYKKEENFNASFELQSINDIAPGRDLSNELGTDWGYGALIIFTVLTLLILLPACFNYSNISISRALKRMKEIGLRKVMGGQRDQILLQFITETVIITFIALGISYYLFTLVRYEFLSVLVGGHDILSLDTNARTIAYFLLFALVVGIFTGIVPGLYFSKLNPIQALKSKPTGSSAKFNIRKTLTVFQFALSLGFIMSVVIVLSQYRQTLNYNFGFDQANILDVNLQDVDPEIFRNEFTKLSSVQSMSMSSHVMGAGSSGSTWVKGIDQSDSVEVAQMFVDHNYLSNLNLKLLTGKNFIEKASVNSNHVIVNEEFLKHFKIKQPIDAVNQVFLMDNKKEVVVIGVVKNFHYASLRDPIKSFFFRYDASQFNMANIKVASSDMFSSITEMESVWKTIGGEKKFESQFLEDEIEEAYSFYFTMVKICGFLGLLAITISCLGLLGMVVFTVENRTKEIGVRKVMGASTTTITLLLSKDFAKLMIVAALIATPLTYLFFDKVFLTMQHYKLPIGAFEIIASLLIMLALGFITILSQTVKAAKANPVETLRNE